MKHTFVGKRAEGSVAFVIAIVSFLTFVGALFAYAEKMSGLGDALITFTLIGTIGIFVSAAIEGME